MRSFRRPLRHAGVLAATVAALASACQPRADLAGEPSALPGTTPQVVPSAPVASASASEAPTDPAPRREFDGVRELEVAGFGSALLILPYPEERAPLLVAAHGAGDSPEWQCEHWNSVVRGRYVVLCPRGTSLGGGGYYYKNHLELEKELVAALAALRAVHGAHLVEGQGVYTGYSQGATMGALMVVAHGRDFPALLLVEGGSSEWSAGRAKRFLASGGRSVGFVCGGSGCAGRAERSRQILEKAGLRARVEHVEGGGHTYVGPVGERAARLLDEWLLAP